MEKTIDLKNDEVFRHSVPYHDNVDYSRRAIPTNDSAKINQDMRDIPCGRRERSDLRTGVAAET
jgi:hypothetical protein